MSSSPSLFLDREKKNSVNIFVPIQYFKHFYLISSVSWCLVLLRMYLGALHNTHWRPDWWVGNRGSGSAWRAVIMVRHWPVGRSVLGDQLRHGDSRHKLSFLLTYITYFCELHHCHLQLLAGTSRVSLILFTCIDYVTVASSADWWCDLIWCVNSDCVKTFLCQVNQVIA